MLDLIYSVLKEDSDITGMVGAGAAARIYPYFREPDDESCIKRLQASLPGVGAADGAGT